MKIEAHVFSKEIKSRDQRDQREHEMKLKMVENDHERSMASEKTKQLELEIRLEEMKARRIEMERENRAA